MVPYDTKMEDRVLGGIIHHPEQIDRVFNFFEDNSVLSQGQARILWSHLLRMKRNRVPI